ncbi:MAG TPA: PilZ domain-containing protein [Candidatus Acidoferrales bacterium]|nr:PilZ domain-containing protein [Candidatus Acidoferrales bacterium]
MNASNSFKPSAEGSYANRRTVPRYPLIATVEVVESASELRLSGRISEISRKGCYVDVLNTLPVGTFVQLTISRDSGTFTTTAKIIYVQEAMGMGVAFLDIAADQMATLDSWIAELV